MKQSGEEGIGLAGDREKGIRFKIRESIGAKTFLTMLVLLVTCCIIIYAMVMIFLPKNYRAELENQFTKEFQELVLTLENEGYEKNKLLITNFAMRNSAGVVIVDSEDQEVFVINNVIGNEKEGVEDGETLGIISSFEYKEEIYTLSAEASLEAAAQSYQILEKLIPLIFITVLLVSIIGAYICSRYFSKPIEEICNVAKRMTKLDMTWKCNVSRNDEMGILANSLNEMSEKLRNALTELQEANVRLQRDIEKEKEQERQRIDFFTAVSHELKTPVTILKGELECMIFEVGEYKNRNKYLCHCMTIVKEVEKLINEILLAAQMGGDEAQTTQGKLCLSELLGQCCNRIRGRAEDKGIELIIDIEPNIYYFGDVYLLDKAISNIVDNAIAYSPTDETVKVCMNDKLLFVENTGIHISEEDLKQLFVPFYRVDKSHNRDTGGSGLGLYIVKTIFERHNIKYTFENTEVGMRFSVYFNETNK